MSNSRQTFASYTPIIAHRRLHRSHTTPDRILIAIAHHDTLTRGCIIRIYVDGTEGYYVARLGGLHAITRYSLIFRIIRPAPRIQWYLSFPHRSRRVSYFSGYFCIIYSAGQQEEDYEL